MKLLVEDVSSGQRWLGHTAEEWVNSWDHYGWRTFVKAALVDIVDNNDTTVADRLGALKMLNDATRAGVLPADPHLVSLTCVVMLNIVNGIYRVAWWRRLGLKRRQSAIADRLTGIHWIIATGGQFIQMLATSSDAHASDNAS